MNRRDFLKGGLCLLGCGCGCGPLVAAGRKEDPVRSSQPAAATFPFELAPGYRRNHDTLRHWLHYMLERLGRETTLRIWNQGFQGPADELTESILASGWESSKPAEDKSGKIEFPPQVEGVTREQAEDMLVRAPTLAAMKKRYDDLRVTKPVTPVDAMHLIFDEPARLTEALVKTLGKQGELVAYDIVRALRIRRAGGRPEPLPVADFMKGFAAFAESKEVNLFTTGLDVQVVKASDSEIVMRIKRCAWADYFRNRHSSVGYLLSCSTDDAEYRTTNPSLRMQRTTTLMEGGESCDFRIYSVGPTEAGE